MNFFTFLEVPHHLKGKEHPRAVGDGSEHSGILGNIHSLYPAVDASNIIPPRMTVKNVPRHSQVALGGQNCPQLSTTATRPALFCFPQWVCPGVRLSGQEEEMKTPAIQLRNVPASFDEGLGHPTLQTSSSHWIAGKGESV